MVYSIHKCFLAMVFLKAGLLTWGTEIDFRGCWGRSHMWR